MHSSYCSALVLSETLLGWEGREKSLLLRCCGALKAEMKENKLYFLYDAHVFHFIMHN